MIWVAAIDSERQRIGTAAANLVASMSAYLPAVWPPHRYDEFTAPNGAFQESTIDRSAPHFPGKSVRVPEWTENGPSYEFAQTEADKVTTFQTYLFPLRGVEPLSSIFGTDPLDVFVPFNSRGDINLEGGKFPRDQWKAGSFDVEIWQQRRIGIALQALQVILEIDRINGENVALSPSSWIMTKFVEGPLTDDPGQMDTTFANVPELMEDIAHGDWRDLPAYLRVAQTLQDGDPSWTGSGASFAVAANSYQTLFIQLQRIIPDYFDTCFTVWRTGSQTRRRDQYE